MRRRPHLLAILLTLIITAPPNASAADATESPPQDAWALGGDLDQEAIRDYLNAIDRVSLEIELEVGGTQGSTSKLGAILARRGTTLAIVATFDTAGLNAADRARGPVITKLAVGPKDDETFQLGPLHIKGLWLGPEGQLCLGFDVKFIKTFQERLCITSIERDGDALVFNSSRKGLLSDRVPEMRISAEGVVQKFKKKFFLFGRGGSWQAVGDADTPRVPMPLPIHQWPIHLSDLLDWLPLVSTADEDKDEARKPLPIPISRLRLSFESGMEHGVVKLANSAGNLTFSDHEINLKINGRFEGRTFKTDRSQKNALVAKWSMAGDVSNRALGKMDIAGIKVALEGGLNATLPFEDITQREANVDFNTEVGINLSAVSARTKQGMTVTMPGGLSGRITGRGSAELVAGQESPRITLSRDSRMSLTIPGPIAVGRAPADNSAPPGALDLPDVLNLSAASVGKPLLQVDGKLGTISGTGTSRNLIFVDAALSLAALGGDAFGLRTPEGLSVTFAPGAGIGVNANLHGAGGKEGLERIIGAALAIDLRMPDDGGEFRLRTEDGMNLGGRFVAGSRISIDTGSMTSAGDLSIVTPTEGGKIDSDLSLHFGEGGIPSAIQGAARLRLGGRFFIQLDPAQLKTESGSPLVGPVRTDLMLELDLAAGTAYRPPDSPAPIVFKTPVRLDLGLAGAFGPGADPSNLGAIEVSVEKPLGVKVKMKPQR